MGGGAAGSLDGFEELIFENGHEFLAGDPQKIRRRAMSRHKSDRRDAETILDLLMHDEFPRVWDGRRREDRGVPQMLSHWQYLGRGVRPQVNEANFTSVPHFSRHCSHG